MTAIPNTRFAVFVLQFSLNPPKNNATRKSAKPEKADIEVFAFQQFLRFQPVAFLFPDISLQELNKQIPRRIGRMIFLLKQEYRICVSQSFYTEYMEFIFHILINPLQIS